MREWVGNAPFVYLTLGRRQVWVVSAVDDYRLAASWGGKEDVVWEVGAATGVTTALLAQAAKEVVAVEKAPEKRAKLRLLAAERENVQVIEGDALTESLPIPPGSRADWLFVDLGGDAPPWRTIAAAGRWAEALQCERIVVRCTKLHEALGSVQAGLDASCSVSPNGTHRASTSVLIQSVMTATGPEVAERLVAELAGGSYRERKRLVAAIRRLGSVALRPLAALVADTQALLAARRTAADAISEIVAELGGVTAALQGEGKGSIPLQWAVMRALGQHARRLGGLSADRLPDGKLLLEMLMAEDDLTRFIARRHLRKQSTEAARALAYAICRAGASVGELVAGLDALGAFRGASAEEIAVGCTEAAGPDQELAIRRRIACAVLGVADQRWAAELLRALEGVAEPGVAQHLEALRAAAQRGARADELARRVSETVAAGVTREDVTDAIAASPHPWMRAVAAVVGEPGE